MGAGSWESRPAASALQLYVYVVKLLSGLCTRLQVLVQYNRCPCEKKPWGHSHTQKGGRTRTQGGDGRRQARGQAVLRWNLPCPHLGFGLAASHTVNLRGLQQVHGRRILCKILFLMSKLCFCTQMTLSYFVQAFLKYPCNFLLLKPCVGCPGLWRFIWQPVRGTRGLRPTGQGPAGALGLPAGGGCLEPPEWMRSHGEKVFPGRRKWNGPHSRRTARSSLLSPCRICAQGSKAVQSCSEKRVGNCHLLWSFQLFVRAFMFMKYFPVAYHIHPALGVYVHMYYSSSMFYE